MNKLMVAGIALLGVCAASAAEVTLKSAPQSLADWKSDDFYVDGKAPSEGDVVVLPANMTAKVDDTSISFVSKFAQIKPIDKTSSVLIVDIANDQSLGCAVYNNRRLHSETVSTSGRIVKKGAGALSLAATSPKDSYFTDIDVQEGALALVPRAGMNDRFYGRINVAENATLVLGSDPDPALTTQNWMIKLTGAGVVTNGVGEALRCVLMPGAGYGETAEAEFSGRIVGRINWWSHGNQRLTGTDSTFSGGFSIKGNQGTSNRGITGVMKIGEAGQPSSTGTGGSIILRESGGRILYLGAGEKTGKTFQLHAQDGSYPCVIDAGATGGLVLTGKVNASHAAIERLVLTGSNTIECVLAGSANVYSESGKSHAMYLNKKGTGTWRLTDSTERTGIVGVGVEEGTLAFGSLAETGTVCSVGKGDYFLDDVRVVDWANIERVPYQFKLGTATTRGTLEYTGAMPFANRTRPTALVGDGALANSGTNAAGDHVSTYYNAGVYALTAGLKTLVLSGVGTNDNVIGSISNGLGVVAVEKTGTGRWILGGTNNTFTGGIAVKDGTLVLRGVAGKYTWYRWTLRQARWQDLGQTGQKEMRIEQFGLYDAANQRVNGGLQMPASYVFEPSGYPKVAVGSAVLGKTTAGFQFYDAQYGQSLTCLFDNEWNTSAVKKNAVQLKGDNLCSTNTPATWISVLMRMAPDCAEVATYDVAQFVPSKDNYGYAPRSWLLEGSVDGETWYVCDDVDDAPWPKTSSYASWWMKGGYRRDSISAATHTGGWTIPGSTNAVTIAYSGPVSVAAGAVLEAEGLVSINSLVADASSAGTIRGVTLAANGTFVLKNKISSVLTLPLVLEDVKDFNNLKNWQVKIGDKVTQYSVALTSDGKIKILPVGLMLIVR